MNNVRSFLFTIFISTLVTVLPLSGQLDTLVSPSFHNQSQIFKISAGIQFWNIYSIDHRIYNEDLGAYSSNSSWNSLLRRSRINILTTPSHRLTIQSNFSFDQIGKDNDSSVNGGASNQSKGISVLDLYARWQGIEKSSLLYVTTGLQRPQLGRETLVSSLKTSSFEKSISQYYQRKQITGFGHGRLLGLNIGGYLPFPNKTITLKYNLGVFNTQSFYGDNTATKKSPLWSGRIGIDIGDPESKSYSTNAKTNYFGLRHGLSIATSFTYQDKTFLFDSNSSISVDALFNMGYLNIDGEIFTLLRTHTIGGEALASRSTGGYLRAGYSVAVPSRLFVEPVIMYTFFNGGITNHEVNIANSLGTYSGLHSVLEVGVNYYVSHSIKLSMFYTNDSSNHKLLQEEFTTNLHFVDSIGRHIDRGNQISIGLIIII